MSNNNQEPQIQPQALPTQIGIRMHGEHVVLQFFTAQGMNVFFLDHAIARACGEKLLEMVTGVIPAAPNLASVLADAAMRQKKRT